MVLEKEKHLRRSPTFNLQLLTSTIFQCALALVFLCFWNLAVWVASLVPFWTVTSVKNEAWTTLFLLWTNPSQLTDDWAVYRFSNTVKVFWQSPSTEVDMLKSQQAQQAWEISLTFIHFFLDCVILPAFYCPQWKSLDKKPRLQQDDSVPWSSLDCVYSG